jgi:anti-anti-sigma factor
MSIAQLVESGAAFHIFQHCNTETIEMTKEFTVVEAVPFQKNFSLVCERTLPPPPLKVSLDFSKTSFMDSSGIGALMSIVKMAKNAGITLAICGLTPQVNTVFTMTGLDRVLKIESEETSDGLSANDKSSHLPVTHASIRSRTKRVIDVLGAIVGLTMTGLLFIPIAIAIRSDGPGSLFFCQTRCGWMGREFKLWKFRSMVPDAEALKHEVKNEAQGAIFKAKHDPRITKIGHFLRRTSLDELPQFWNVLLGSMSLVGTRPPTADEIDQYAVPEWRRLDVKPGITGEWQVHGRSSIKDFEDVIRLDLRYQRNWGLLHDIKLMFKTVAVVFSKDSGAM